MKIATKLYITFGVMLAVALLNAGLAIWTAQQASFHLERANLAHRQYQAHLSLSSHTYQLFKELGDALLLGDRDGGARARELEGLIRGDLLTLRRTTAREIELVGEEEFEELDFLAEIEAQIGRLLAEYREAITAVSEDGVARQWSRLALVLDEHVDRDFQAMIQRGIDGEAEELAEVREETAGQIWLNQVLAGLFSLVAIVAASVSLWSLIRGIRTPIENFVAAAEAYEGGDLGRRVESTGAPEFAGITHAFNRLADRFASRESELSEMNRHLEDQVALRTEERERLLAALKASDETRRRLMADVSHELRTPLGIIKGEVDNALQGEEKPPSIYRGVLVRARDMADHTIGLVDDLLLIARQDAGEIRLKLHRFDLAALVRQAVDEHGKKAARESKTLRFDCDEAEASIEADAECLRKVIDILVANGLQAAEREVVVHLNRSPGGFVVRVADDGPGLTEQEQSSVFERFSRAPNAAPVGSDNIGLGLPVAKAIIEAHGSMIAIDSRPGGGAAFSFALRSGPNIAAVA